METLRWVGEKTQAAWKVDHCEGSRLNEMSGLLRCGGGTWQSKPHVNASDTGKKMSAWETKLGLLGKRLTSIFMTVEMVLVLCLGPGRQSSDTVMLT